MRKIVAVLMVSGLVLAACAPEEETPEAAPTTSPEAEVDECATESLNLVTPGQLTVGTDNPAFPPWFEGGTPDGSSWEINDPSTGEGFESAVAYAVAGELGFTEDQVAWTE
ncbi:MAG TPA: amino acid ABC transporter substrate-binding protein, partial [Gemmatimonadota bacterium]|nr:amino acid ABC transporter substrate-binding protein [Gemmatimonadota bacterium]